MNVATVCANSRLFNYFVNSMRLRLVCVTSFSYIIKGKLMAHGVILTQWNHSISIAKGHSDADIAGALWDFGNTVEAVIMMMHCGSDKKSKGYTTNCYDFWRRNE